MSGSNEVGRSGWMTGNPSVNSLCRVIALGQPARIQARGHQTRVLNRVITFLILFDKSCHSYRSATMGSTRMARRAGT